MTNIIDFTEKKNEINEREAIEYLIDLTTSGQITVEELQAIILQAVNPPVNDNEVDR